MRRLASQLPTNVAEVCKKVVVVGEYTKHPVYVRTLLRKRLRKHLEKTPCPTRRDHHAKDVQKVKRAGGLVSNFSHGVSLEPQHDNVEVFYEPLSCSSLGLMTGIRAIRIKSVSL
jgi:hypothetical protein